MSIVPKFLGGTLFDTRTVVVNSTIYFCAKDVAEMLQYANTKNACKNNVKAKYRRPLHEIIDASQLPPNERNSIYISEPGLLQWAARSEQPKAQPFQDWLYEECLPKLRSSLFQQQIGFKSEADLHCKVVSFIKKYYPHALLSAGLGELQDSSEKRLDAWRKGYRKGTPDVTIHNHHVRYSGFVIEFKNPSGSGTASQSQKETLATYARNNFKTMLTNNYDDIVVSIIDYMADTRICCPYCQRKFKTEQSLQTHVTHFHRC